MHVALQQWTKRREIYANKEKRRCSKDRRTQKILDQIERGHYKQSAAFEHELEVGTVSISLIAEHKPSKIRLKFCIMAGSRLISLTIPQISREWVS